MKIDYSFTRLIISVKMELNSFLLPERTLEFSCALRIK